MSSSRLVTASVAVASLGVGFAGGWLAHARRTRPAPVAPVIAPPPRPLTRPPAPPRPEEPAREPAPTAAPARVFRSNHRHTGRSGYALPLDLEVAHRVRTGGRISTQPVVNTNGRVVFGSHDGALYGVDVDRGSVLWRLNTGDRIYSTPAVAEDGLTYAGTDADRLFSVDQRGHLQWALGTDADADTSPALAPDQTVRFAAGKILYATTRDLTIRWRLQFGAKLYSSPLVLDDGTTLIGCQDDKLYAVDPAGAIRWQHETGADVDSPPAVHNDTVYFGSDDGHVYALSVADGTRRWRTSVGGYVRAGVAIGLDGRVVVGTFGPNPRIVALDGRTGAIAWSVAVTGGPPTAEWGVASSALVDRDGRYAVGLPTGELVVIERDGTVLDRVRLGDSPVDSSPILVRDALVAVGNDEGTLFLLGPSRALSRDADVSSTDDASVDVR
ncbi:MAG: PQQ-binding-like beta-propeller repeat protein [Myxococcales bacterium]|nr:PQQ-binding-like beta-propeller repeat protein [Myxococcales bacterium]